MAIGKTNAGGGGGVGGVLTVTAPAGVTVSVTKDGKTKRKTANAEGLAVFKGLATGTWTLTITDGVQTSTKPVVIIADYETVIAFFSATINITYPAGSTCTCTDGTTTLTAPDTSGVWTCTVPNAGTWTASCSSGSQSASNRISITTAGQVAQVVLSYYVYLFKDGDECSNLTGGWDNAAYKVDGYACNRDSGAYGNAGGQLFCTGRSGAHGGMGTNKLIDLTNYKTICVKGYTTSATESSMLYVATDRNVTVSPAAVVMLPTYEGVVSVDISYLSGGHYIFFGASANTKATSYVKQIYLEMK